MLSRVANSVYWMSRYVERAENIARFISVNHNMLMDLPIESTNQWESLITATGDAELFKQRYDDINQKNVVDFLTFDENYYNSIYSCIRLARENARTIREQISSEIWLQINEMFLELSAHSAKRQMSMDLNAFCAGIKNGCTLFNGLCDSSMTHGETWEFIRLGRMLERADKTSRVLDVKYYILLPDPNYVGTPYDNIQWAALLKSVSGLEMYRLEHLRIRPMDVVGFLILDTHFPRSIRHCIAASEQCLHTISGSRQDGYSNLAERSIGRLASELAYTEIEEIMQIGVHEFVDGIQTQLNRTGAAIAETFFGVS